MKNENFEKLLYMDHTAPGDTERQALFWIMSNTSLYDYAKAIYDFDDHSINYLCIEEMIWSSAETKLLHIAFNLYNGYKHEGYTLIDLIDGLDSHNMMVVLTAIFKRFPNKFDNSLEDKIKLFQAKKGNN